MQKIWCPYTFTLIPQRITTLHYHLPCSQKIAYICIPTSAALPEFLHLPSPSLKLGRNSLSQIFSVQHFLLAFWTQTFYLVGEKGTCFGFQNVKTLFQYFCRDVQKVN